MAKPQKKGFEPLLRQKITLDDEGHTPVKFYDASKKRYLEATGRADVVPPDQQVAVAWFQKAAEAGDADGMNNLGMMYLRGDGVERSFATAARWWRLAVERGGAAPTGGAAAEKARRNLELMERKGLI